MKPLFTLRRALADPHLLGGLIDGPSWRYWRALLIAAMGEELTEDERILFREVTNRDAEPGERVEEAWLVIGRRGGKSRSTAVLGAYLAALVDYSDVLAPGEEGILAVMAATTRQAEISLGYLAAIFADPKRPLFHRLLKNQTAETVELHNHVTVEVRPASFKTIRGISAVAIIADEIAFWSSGDMANPDSEILNAARPALATTGGMMVAISSPHSRRGELWTNYHRHYGPAGDPRILVANAPSRTMNETLSAKVVERAYEKDPALASAEYGGQFRTDVENFVSRDVAEAAVVVGRHELPPMQGTQYVAFTDPSGSGADAMTIAIAHAGKDGTAVLDAVRIKRPPFSPAATVAEFADLLKAYKVTKVVGDHWGGEFVKEPFRKAGIEYEKSEKTASDIFRDMLSALNSGTVELLDNSRLLAELISLERRTARSGKDQIGHPPGGHDDVINAAAGALLLVTNAKHPFVVTDEMLAMASKPTAYSQKHPNRRGNAIGLPRHNFTERYRW